MKTFPLIIAITTLSLTLSINGCNEKPEINSESNRDNTTDIINNNSDTAKGAENRKGELDNNSGVIDSNLNERSNNSGYFKTPLNLAGTGCPIGTSAVKQEMDGFQVSFNDYSAGNKGAKRRTSCSLAAPMTIPEGYQITSISANWQGVSQGKVEFRYKYFVAGDPQSNWHVVPLNHETRTKFSEEKSVAYKSECGADKILRVASSVRAKQAGAYISVHNLINFKVAVKPCNAITVQ
jgi:hypothetical protein